jgi:hypothetical protein
MSDSEAGELRLCTECIGSKRFSAWINANSARGKCDFKAAHGRSHKVIDIERFAIEVDSFFRETYQLGEEYPCFYGESDATRTLSMLSQKNLPDADHYDIAQGDTAFHDETLNYERTADAEKRDRENWEEHWYQNRFSYQWQDFCATVQYETRFFKNKELLDQLFGSPSEYDEGAVKPVYFLKAGTKLYRARLLDNEFTEEALQKNPTLELGAPPKERARAGRMNVEYIPAFYAAFCEETAVSEIRPGIGDKVAVGEFVLAGGLKVFDFTAFSSPGNGMERARQTYPLRFYHSNGERDK